MLRSVTVMMTSFLFQIPRGLLSVAMMPVAQGSRERLALVGSFPRSPNLRTAVVVS